MYGNVCTTVLSNCSLPSRVAQSPDTKMGMTNLARVFGPTIVGHGVPDPDPLRILQDTKRQPRVERGNTLLLMS